MAGPESDPFHRISLWRAFPSLMLAGSVAATLVVVALSRPDRVGTLSVVFGIAAVIAGALASTEGTGRPSVSAGFIIFVLAAAFLGPASAAAAAVILEAAAATNLRTPRRSMFLGNIPTGLISALVAAVIVRGLASHPSDGVVFYVAVAAAGMASNVAGFLTVAPLQRALSGSWQGFTLPTFVAFLPSTALSVLLAVAGSAITVKLGNAGIAFALAGVFAFTYMSHLLQESRRRAEQYVALSWGVLAGLMRSMDIRDERAARHSAGVARFARDIARATGFDEREQELAHTAGLLHDIGRFALSDRVAERGRTLNAEDWEAIQRHPELGADMLRDLVSYGPVAEIVLAHHERIDGRGYPQGLIGEEIPEIAKIIAVAEVYDTLTASDTYRTQMSSFEALNELRRVAGSQLDEHYVAALAGLLGGEGIEYRHADAADFDVELGMERRIHEAGAGG